MSSFGISSGSIFNKSEASCGSVPEVHGLPLLPPFLSYPLVINLYAPVMKTPQLSFSRIVRESGTTLVVTMGLYLVPGCTVALLPTANYRHFHTNFYIAHLALLYNNALDMSLSPLKKFAVLLFLYVPSHPVFQRPIEDAQMGKLIGRQVH